MVISLIIIMVSLVITALLEVLTLLRLRKMLQANINTSVQVKNLEDQLREARIIEWKAGIVGVHEESLQKHHTKCAVERLDRVEAELHIAAIEVLRAVLREHAAEFAATAFKITYDEYEDFPEIEAVGGIGYPFLNNDTEEHLGLLRIAIRAANLLPKGPITITLH